MKCLISYGVALMALSLGAAAATANNITILHSFGNSSSDGDGPAYDGLVLGGSTLYGSTDDGGANYSGTIFSINLDNSQYGTVCSLPSSLISPYGLTMDGPTILGTSLLTTTGQGCVYSIQTTGTGFQVLHTFTGANGDGAQSYSRVVLSGSTVYGTTCIGGAYDGGTVFSMAKDGTNYKVLYSFARGSDLYGAPTIVGSTLYGMSSDSIYKMNTDGTGFQVLKSNVGGIGSLTLSGSTLYGTNDIDSDEVFSIGTDGSNFRVLYVLSGESQSGLVLVGSTLYGVTRWGGSANEGTVFSLDTDGSDYTLLHSFVGGIDDGEQPLCEPIVVGSTLYGTTELGGAYGVGTVFALTLPTPEPSTIALLAAGALGLVGYGWRRRLARTPKPSAFDQPDAPHILSFPSHSSPAHAARRAA